MAVVAHMQPSSWNKLVLIEHNIDFTSHDQKDVMISYQQWITVG